MLLPALVALAVLVAALVWLRLDRIVPEPTTCPYPSVRHGREECSEVCAVEPPCHGGPRVGPA